MIHYQNIIGSCFNCCFKWRVRDHLFSGILERRMNWDFGIELAHLSVCVCVCAVSATADVHVGIIGGQITASPLNDSNLSPWLLLLHLQISGVFFCRLLLESYTPSSSSTCQTSTPQVGRTQSWEPSRRSSDWGWSGMSAPPRRRCDGAGDGRLTRLIAQPPVHWAGHWILQIVGVCGRDWGICLSLFLPLFPALSFALTPGDLPLPTSLMERTSLVFLWAAFDHSLSKAHWKYRHDTVLLNVSFWLVNCGFLSIFLQLWS